MTEEANVNVIEVAGQMFDLSHPKPSQVAGLVRIFARVNLGARGKLTKIKDATEMDYIMAFLGEISDDDLITLSALSIGSDKKFAEENFDLMWVTKALTVLVANSHLMESIANFTSMLSPAVDMQEQ